MNRKQLLAIAALSLSATLSSVVSAESVSSESRVVTGSTSRAEVAADRNLWLKAGLGRGVDNEYVDPSHAQRMANYTRMRNGPEYVAEVSRIQSGKAKTTAMNTATGE